MTGQDLQCQSGRFDPLSKSADVDRLLRLMAGWWQGRAAAEMAAREGISRQRVRAILVSVGCTRHLWSKADHERPDSPRRGHRRGVSEAREVLSHPLAHCLTVRQRAAVAWRARGLVLLDVARRMKTTAQGVQRLLVAGRWRLERLEARRAASSRHSCLPKPAVGVATEPPDIGPIDITGMIDDLVAGTDGPGE